MVAPTWPGGRRAREALLDLWVLVPVVVLGWPLLTRGGYPFARDLVLTPRLPLRPESVGLGTSSPRAAPLDAVVGVLSLGVDGAVLGRLAVLGGLALAGWGAHRLAGPLGVPARLLVGALAVWNPFVVERLGLGQWALLLAYAALWWVAHAAVRARADGRLLPRLAPWLALGALTPTGAVLTGAVALAAGLRRRGAGGRADLGLLGLVGAAQLPWLLPSLLSSATATSDPAGVAAFAARAELPGPALLSLLGLGGVWDRLSVPGSRSGVLGALTVLVVLAGLVAGWRRGLPGRRLRACGLVGLLLAALTSVPLGEQLVAAGTDVVPGLGLLRDAQKWLAPFVVVAVLGVGALLDVLAGAVARRAAALSSTVLVVALALPFVLLPDGAVVVHRVLAPSRCPAEVGQVAAAVDGRDGLLVSAPWRLYRAYPWATAYPTYDPASRLYDVRVVTSDALALGDRTLRGEDPLAAAVGRALDPVTPASTPALRALGVRWVLVTRTDPDGPALLEDLRRDPGARLVVDGPDLALLELTGPRAAEPGVAPAALVAVVGTDLAVLLLLVGVGLSRPPRGRP
ncbi:hypothetical protein [Arthrobacter sp. NEB 688]|uniref:hypothetical protein n=1 Tax=Arthrobacter sp. NEB 688 TaxID=904039 RepID=UPI001566365A|nr:hypothetical protein [Arthrobacter sp. NEB 688]QKE84895.1 hypothetical protein HL663_13730 [Arthrobacter sp. NEB 688]